MTPTARSPGVAEKFSPTPSRTYRITASHPIVAASLAQHADQARQVEARSCPDRHMPLPVVRNHGP